MRTRERLFFILVEPTRRTDRGERDVQERFAQ
jgi:hypothetical protein